MSEHLNEWEARLRAAVATALHGPEAADLLALRRGAVKAFAEALGSAWTDLSDEEQRERVELYVLEKWGKRTGDAMPMGPPPLLLLSEVPLLGTLPSEALLPPPPHAITVAARVLGLSEEQVMNLAIHAAVKLVYIGALIKRKDESDAAR